MLSRDSVPAGHVVTSVSTFWSPGRPLALQWWVWFDVTWADGRRENPFEDYEPWEVVGEVKRGVFTWEGPDDRAGEYQAVWLEGEEKAVAFSALRP